MGGRAFNFLEPGSFPRIPTPVYQPLKARFQVLLQALYVHVGVPTEAPEKPDHGDLDFIVCTPITRGSLDSVNVPHDQVKAALGATHCILVDGNQTSNFAVPISRDTWRSLDHDGASTETFYQVDVHVCADKNEWDRIMYFHSYGDLGMIQGLIARNVGLVLGVNGLKYPNPPHQTLTLNQDFSAISRFFGWSIERRNAGFTSRQEVFEWVINSRFFDASCFRTSGDGITKVKAERTMYSDFVTWVKDQVTAGVVDMEEYGQRRERVRKEALEEFGCLEEVETTVRIFEARRQLKQVFNGTSVNAWTGLNGHWKAVKVVMDMVRERHHGEGGILQILMSEGENGVKQRVLEALRDSEFSPPTENSSSHGIGRLVY
ncbi:hypothetical protein BDP27DRAFT_1311432 [Rhodocollybia butyracea]|uniref:Uncharacterized protein n=1 Tax=Rhodocollybia butyracea TaxID=206335 RepID=A0A9P5Q9Q9_9AGAR|nr:hypothetical protein BDP27DRAFT_1311432 [Rhodocollybia butyracea]